MKEEEEAPSKKMPPKMSVNGSGTSSASNNTSVSTPTKATNDEILSSLLRYNNFDSISSLKDESLDIDLSACVTISTDPMGIINGNSLSSADFWRVLDESAQNAQLDNDDSNALIVNINNQDQDQDIGSIDLHTTDADNPSHIGDRPIAATCTLKRDQLLSSFSGTFLRPEPRMVTPSMSPLKKTLKSLPAEQQQQQQKLKAKPASIGSSSSKRPKVSPKRKEEFPEQLKVAYLLDNATSDTSPANKTKLLMSSNFNVLMLPTTATATTFANTATATTITTTATATVSTANAAPDSEASLVSVEPQTVYKCIDCSGLVLHGSEELSRHELASHRIRYQCGICEREFDQEAGLKKHIKTHRSVDARKDTWRKCPDCGKCLKLGSMWMHRKIHSDNKKYGCDICGQKFVQKINLTHHSRVHTSEKPYECPECQKRFQERSHLQRHQKYHAQTRSYRCEKCGKMYKTERCLKVHNLVHLEQRPFACNVCNKSFISNSKLKQHSNIHTGERPFKCNYCPRDFTNFPNWLKHTRRRHKVDHKTGEHLENIPSYCSKKSTKTAKPPPAKPVETTCSKTEVNQDLGVKEILPPAPPKAPVKRKKKEATPTVGANVAGIKIAPVTATKLTKTQPLLQTASASASVSTVPTSAITNETKSKMTKVRRERKQLMPKQVQKAPLPAIKEEPNELKTEDIMKPVAMSRFSDVHCLSITSAEELIMEQALEMEECGLYDASVTVAAAQTTDNAVSSDTAAALHFKIKNEFPVDEEFIALKDANNRVFCSSLESSPFSSPGSMDLAASAMKAKVPPLVITNDMLTPVTAFYMPTLSISSQDMLVAQSNSQMSSPPTSNMGSQQPSAAQPLLVQQMMEPQSAIVHTQEDSALHTLMPHLYLPMTVSMPLLVQPNQVLPSVDTLFFSTQTSGGGFLRSKGVSHAHGPSAQHNLS